MLDSGPRLFMDGEYYYRQFDDLAVNLCVAKTMTDAGWREYLEGSLDMSKKLGRPAKLCAVAFVHAHPNAGQRRMATEFLKRHGLPPVDRLGLLSDSTVLRAAMTAFGWVMPKSQMRAFPRRDIQSCLEWLRERGKFDVQQVLSAWKEARVQFAAKM